MSLKQKEDTQKDTRNVIISIIIIIVVIRTWPPSATSACARSTWARSITSNISNNNIINIKYITSITSITTNNYY